MGSPRTGARDAWLLQLRVRRGKAAYAVSNIVDLARAWQTGVEVSYGRNLALVHDSSAFTLGSRRLLDVAARVVDSQQALAMRTRSPKATVLPAPRSGCTMKSTCRIRGARPRNVSRRLSVCRRNSCRPPPAASWSLHR